MKALIMRCTLPLAVAMGVMVTPTYAMTPRTVQIQIQDQCNPATFNAVIGPGTCIGNGAVTFTHFFNEVQQLHSAPQWHFAPPQLQMTVGQTFIATNVGGEMHSFTEVQQFGGGIVPFLNSAAGITSVAPECSVSTIPGANGLLPPAPQALASFVSPGGTPFPLEFSDTEGPNDVGHPVMYQCCIHPWMHEVITVNP
jgi:hypothetical protein